MEHNQGTSTGGKKRCAPRTSWLQKAAVLQVGRTRRSDPFNHPVRILTGCSSTLAGWFSFVVLPFLSQIFMDTRVPIDSPEIFFCVVITLSTKLLLVCRGFCRGIISYTSYSRTNDCIYNGYDNINLEPNAMNNIDTVAHMNMHYTQY